MQNTVKFFLFAAFMLVIVAGLTACAAMDTADRTAAGADGPLLEAIPVEQMAAPVSDIQYLCDGRRRVHVRLQGPKRIDLDVDGAKTSLNAVRSASGAKFQSNDGSIVFWTKGNEAHLKTSDDIDWRCIVIE